MEILAGCKILSIVTFVNYRGYKLARESNMSQHGKLNINMRGSNKGAVICAVCPESAWLVTFLIGNVSTGVVTWSALRCGASDESGKKVAATPLSKTATAAAAAKTWFAKHPLGYMLHNWFPWKRSGRRSSMWPPYSLRRNLSVLCLLASPGHQHPWYRPCKICRSLSYIRWDIIYLYYVSMEEWYQL